MTETAVEIEKAAQPTLQQYPNAVHLTVASAKRSIKFYRDKLGFTLCHCYPDTKQPVWASLVLDRQNVMVGELVSPEAGKEMGMSKDERNWLKKESKAFAKHEHGVGVAVYLHVADVDRYCRALKKRRVPAVVPLKTQFYGIRDFTVEDPDGYRLVFYMPIEGHCTETHDGESCSASGDDAH